MLIHRHPAPVVPARAVILGETGFVAHATALALHRVGIPTVALGRAALDLTAPEADTRLAATLQPSDVLVFVSAKAPCRTPEGLIENLAMARAVAAALGRVKVAQLVYISSDAVYADTEALVRETTPTAPGSLHGQMHAAREAILRTIAGIPLAILRPSLLYGPADPHNGYGPNSFRRLAEAGKTITLFGEGEEQRDHVLIDDVARLVALVVLHGSTGTLNVATGRSLSFRRVAELAVEIGGGSIVGSPRRNPIRHRHFDPTGRIRAFPDFAFTPLEIGLRGG